jgi:hypothetical protein
MGSISVSNQAAYASGVKSLTMGFGSISRSARAAWRAARPLARSCSVCTSVMSFIGLVPVLRGPHWSLRQKTRGPMRSDGEPNRSTKREYQAKATCSDRDSGFALARSMLASTMSRVPNCHTGEQHCGERRHKEVAAGPQRSRDSEASRWQRSRGSFAPRSRKASRARAPDSPPLGEDRSPNGPARQRIRGWCWMS